MSVEEKLTQAKGSIKEGFEIVQIVEAPVRKYIMKKGR